MNINTTEALIESKTNQVASLTLTDTLVDTLVKVLLKL